MQAYSGLPGKVFPSIDLLHVTAHLGGGVGKVLSRLVEASNQFDEPIAHTIVCLQRPEKSQFALYAEQHGARLLICPSRDTLSKHIAKADIVQVEWWHHPVMAGWLCGGILPPSRMVVWSHVSGLNPPEIPKAFLVAPHRFLFSSPCSWDHPQMLELSPKQRDRIHVVHSSGGFADLPQRQYSSLQQGPLRIGYLGTLNFAKLHPGLFDFLEAVTVPHFLLTLIGDPTGSEELLALAPSRHISERLEFRGYTTDVASELANFDVLAYLLNPLHYGTTENALLEAMAMGVVPVVLDNPAERHLVKHGETGLVVNSPAAFAKALTFLAENPERRAELSANASRDVRARFAIRQTAARLNSHYQEVMGEPKRSFDFRPIFGHTPSEWFRSCQGPEAWRFDDDAACAASNRVGKRGPHYLYEKAKGSVFHYRDTYPEDMRLERWARNLEATR